MFRSEDGGCKGTYLSNTQLPASPRVKVSSSTLQLDTSGDDFQNKTILDDYFPQHPIISVFFLFLPIKNIYTSLQVLESQRFTR